MTEEKVKVIYETKDEITILWDSMSLSRHEYDDDQILKQMWEVLNKVYGGNNESFNADNSYCSRGNIRK